MVIQLKVGTLKRKKSGKGKKNRKHGRNKKFCERYRMIGQREKNKAKRAVKERKKREKKRAKLASI